MRRRKRGWKAASGLSLDALRRMVVEKHAALTARREELGDELAAIDADLDADVAAAPKRGRMPGKRGPGRPRKVGRRRGRPAKVKQVRRTYGKRRGRKVAP